MPERRQFILREAHGDDRWQTLIRAGFALLAVIPAMLRFGWHEDDQLLPTWLTLSLQIASLALYAFICIRPALPHGFDAVRALVRRSPIEFTILALAIPLAWSWQGLALIAGLIAASNLLRLYFLVIESEVPTGLVFVGSFILLIFIGTLLLKLPAATPPDQPISTLHASFTITSAISQTGLVVRPTGDGFTRMGQWVILIWIQIGALGIILFGSFFALFLGASFGLRATQTLAEPTEQGWAGQLSLKKLAIFIILLTHIVELFGAAVFYFGWPDEWVGAPGMETAGDRMFHSLFFSVSSFCNAGFVTTANSVQGLRVHWTSHLVITTLIVIGSIGFPVLDDLVTTAWHRIRRRRVRRGNLVRLSLNTRITLATTAIIYILSMLLILLGEITQANVPFFTAVLDSHFMTINRTAGFDTIPPAEMGLLSQLTLILGMFIGGSPGSVAGGIKVIALAVLALTVWSTIMGRRETQAFGRTIPDELVRKCAMIIVLSLATVMAVAGVLAATETGGPGAHELDELLFEAVSAFGTCGLSMGITSELTPAGHAALIVGMFVGRVGPLATLAALMSIARDSRQRYTYPTESVVIY
ncbi:MAG: potassium transporter TrkG [Planctomycetota bacterium]|nr:potassium transporter TrkG [Planctomycetota bacterium]